MDSTCGPRSSLLAGRIEIEHRTLYVSTGILTLRSMILSTGLVQTVRGTQTVRPTPNISIQPYIPFLWNIYCQKGPFDCASLPVTRFPFLYSDISIAWQFL